MGGDIAYIGNPKEIEELERIGYDKYIEKNKDLKLYNEYLLEKRNKDLKLKKLKDMVSLLGFGLGTAGGFSLVLNGSNDLSEYFSKANENKEIFYQGLASIVFGITAMTFCLQSLKDKISDFYEVK